MAYIDNTLSSGNSTGVFNQNNIFRQLTISYSGKRTNTGFANAINSLPAFSIGERDLYVFVFTNPVADPDLIPTQYKVILKNTGKGNYGIGGITLTGLNVIVIYVEALTYSTAISLQSTDLINYGDIGSISILDYVNAMSPGQFIQDQADGYTIINAIIDDEEVSYLFTGPGGTYGISNTEAQAEYFQLLSDANISGLQNLQSVTDIGNVTTNKIFVGNASKVGYMLLTLDGFLAGGLTNEGDDGSTVLNFIHPLTGDPDIDPLVNIGSAEITVGYGIQLPNVITEDQNFYLPLTVNNQTADINGNITISTGGLQDLQSVLTVGNTSDLSIILSDLVGTANYNGSSIFIDRANEHIRIDPHESISIYDDIGNQGTIQLNNIISSFMEGDVQENTFLHGQNGITFSNGISSGNSNLSNYTHTLAYGQYFTFPEKGNNTFYEPYILATIDDLTLQNVVDNGNTVVGTDSFASIDSQAISMYSLDTTLGSSIDVDDGRAAVSVYDINTAKHLALSTTDGLMINTNGLWDALIKSDNIVNENIVFQLPNKTTGSYILATTADITGGSTNLTYTASATNGIVNSDTGTDATIPLGTGTNAGLLAPAQFTLLSNQSGTNTGDETTATIKTKLGVASTSLDGYLTSTDWNTFNNKENSLTFNLPLTRSGNSISILAAGIFTNGYLSSTDWNIFNNKQSSISLTTTGTGAATFIANTLNIPTPNFTGYLTTSAAASTYFPLTGGTITGTGGNGFIGLIPQSSNPATPSSGVAIYARSTGAFSWKGTNGFQRSFIGTGITADRDYTLPDATGTLVLNDNTVTLTGKTIAAGSNTITGLTNTNLSGSAAISDANISSASTWNAKQNALSGTGLVKSTAGTITYITDNSTNWDSAYTNRINSLTVTGASGSATLVSNVLNIPTYTLSGLGGTTLAAVNAQNLSVFASTTSSQLAGVISDETGTGLLVFNSSPTFAGTPVFASTGFTITSGLTSTVLQGNGVAVAKSTLISTTATNTITNSNTAIVTGDTLVQIAGKAQGQINKQNAYVAKTAAYTIVVDDYMIDCTTGTFTVTLPTAVGISGQSFIIKNSGTGAITLATTSSQTIDGVTSKIYNTQYAGVRVTSDNANWKISGTF